MRNRLEFQSSLNMTYPISKTKYVRWVSYFFTFLLFLTCSQLQAQRGNSSGRPTENTNTNPTGTDGSQKDRLQILAEIEAEKEKLEAMRSKFRSKERIGRVCMSLVFKFA